MSDRPFSKPLHDRYMALAHKDYFGMSELASEAIETIETLELRLKRAEFSARDVILGIDEGRPGGDKTVKVHGLRHPDGRIEITHVEEIEPHRACTCHPDDNPPRPCPQKFALSDCRVAAVTAHGLCLICGGLSGCECHREGGERG